MTRRLRQQIRDAASGIRLSQGKEVVEGAIRHPVAAWFIAIAISLYVASAAAAGLNTIWVGRALLIGVVLTAAAGLFFTKAAEKLTTLVRWLILILVATSCIVLERIEASHFKAAHSVESRRLPQPPLFLMLPPQEPFAIHYPIVIPKENLQIDYIDRPAGGYASFTMDNSSDDVMLGIDGISLKNVSDKPMRLVFSLHVIGEGRDFRLSNDGRGRWQRRLNVNDFMARMDTSEEDRPSWLISPLEIPPGGRAYGALGFVAPNADDSLRNLITKGGIDQRYKTKLEVHDEISGQKFELLLPFGKKPVVDQSLKAAIATGIDRGPSR